MQIGMRFLAILLMTVGLTLGSSAPIAAAAQTAAISPPTPGMLDSAASTNGDIVVWSEEFGATTGNADVVGAHLSDGIVFTIADGVENQSHPKIDGNVVIWIVSTSNCPSCDELHARDLSGGSEVTVASPGQTLSYIDVSGHWVVWVMGSQIMARDISTMDDPVTLATASEGWLVSQVAITGNTVAWVEQTATPNRTYPWQIRVARIGGSGPSVVASGVTFVGNAIGLAVGGNTLVYSVRGITDPYYGELFKVSLYSFVGISIAQNAASPTTDGRYVFWQTQSSYDSPPELRGYDLQTASLFTLPTTALTNGTPDADNGAVVWTTSSRPDLMVSSLKDIQTAWLWEVLPSAPRPNPGTTDPNWLYFPETGHYISFGFKTFWSRSGGLSVFGYPVTEEFSQRNSDLGQMLTVQYLERQRFEYHPELAGTVYETSLGRTGAEDAKARNLVVTQPFQPLPANTASTDACQFFEATRHNACFSFKDYWQSHGLDFGDTGISYRESLALFGYPISEEFVDSQTGYMTQYFERAVFEYHPNNPDPYKVLLKRLGADEVTQQGW